jgi:SAM-dependent methyltransferase
VVPLEPVQRGRRRADGPHLSDDPFSVGRVRAAYDAVADDYVAAFGDDLGKLPLDRAMLDAAWVAGDGGGGVGVGGRGGAGWLLDAGCGPGVVAGHLAAVAPVAVGFDLSTAMLRAAGDRVPGLRRSCGDLRRLPLRSGSIAVAVAYYSLQHVGRADLPIALAELHRVLATGGVLLVATHLGEGDSVFDEFLGHRIEPTAGAYFSRSEVVGALGAAGFTVDREEQRGPLAHEHDSQRLYVIARSGRHGADDHQEPWK